MAAQWTLNNGRQMPILVFGTGTAWFKPAALANDFDDFLAEFMTDALKAGCRHLDSADDYNNHKEVGQAIKASGLPRHEVFVTSKVPGDCDIVASVRKTLGLLGLDYIDLYMIHLPFFASSKAELQHAWAQMEAVHELGLAKSIGVSNFLPQHFDAILETAKVKPAVNQIEYQPFLDQSAQLKYHEAHGIVAQGYGILTPLIKTVNKPLLEFLAQLAQKYGKSEAAVLLNWSIQERVAPVTTTGSEERLEEYLSSTSFQLEPEEVAKITEIGRQTPLRRYLNDHMDNLKF